MAALVFRLFSVSAGSRINYIQEDSVSSDQVPGFVFALLKGDLAHDVHLGRACAGPAVATARFARANLSVQQGTSSKDTSGFATCNMRGAAKASKMAREQGINMDQKCCSTFNNQAR